MMDPSNAVKPSCPQQNGTGKTNDDIDCILPIWSLIFCRLSKCMRERESEERVRERKCDGEALWFHPF